MKQRISNLIELVKVLVKFWNHPKESVEQSLSTKPKPDVVVDEGVGSFDTHIILKHPSDY